MSLTSLIILLIVAGICGSIGRAIAGYSHGGCLVSIALGFIGALVGVWLAGLLHLHNIFEVEIGGEHFPIIWSIIGSALFVAVISFFTRRA
ncbi:MAG TPA: GlsB/YeaQ/YmgE family stress response membrane protein [Blastocatellia bacterium]|nr:GlsB/YeaQ/YmgE family stress response membrane protein [Blastocatellia bacterium]